MASGDAKSKNSNLLRTRTFCSELFTRQTHTTIDWKFHCASFAVWVCRLNVSLQKVTAVQKFITMSSVFTTPLAYVSQVVRGITRL